ncbi:MAG: phosphate signaling complex protein PhoU [Phycisphaerales bacterium]
MPNEPDAAPTPTPVPRPEIRYGFDRSVVGLKRRLIQEATVAIGMLEAALDALWKLDISVAKEVRRRDDRIDQEEVEIEQECYRLLTLEQPFARDFRVITFILKVNSDIERVGDHASSIAKIATRMDATRMPQWPTALVDMGQRVPVMCHSLLRAVLDEDAELARQIIEEDEIIDELEKQLFEETQDLMRKDPHSIHNGLLIYRLGRELERIGDLMKNIAEDVTYLVTGEIVRHEARRQARLAKRTPPAG